MVVGLLLLGTVALALAGLDTGTAFGGMGSSREMTIAALVEPTLLVSVFALSARVGSTSLAAIVGAGAADPRVVFTPASVLALAALASRRWPKPAGSRWTTRPPTWSSRWCTRR